MGHGKVCAICCEFFTVGDKLPKKKRSAAALLEEKLTGLDKDNGFGDKLELLACAKCVTFVTSALESRERVSGKEKRVRKGQLLMLKVQRKVLTMLRELEGAVREFKEAVGGLEGVLEESKGKVGVLEEAMGEGDSVSEQAQGLLADAVQFREKVLQLSVEMVSLYKTSAEVRSNDQHTTQKEAIQPSAREDDQDDVAYGKRLKRKVSEGTDPPPPPPEQDLMEQDNHNFDDDQFSPAADVNDQNDNVDLDRHEVPVGKRLKRRSCARTVNYTEEDPLGEDQMWENSQDKLEDKSNPDLDKHSKDANDNYEPEASGSPDASEHDGDDDSEWEAGDEPEEERALKKRVVNRKMTFKSLQSKFDLTGMSQFKKRVISRVVRQAEEDKQSAETFSSCSVFDAIDPLKLHPITYDPSIDKLVIGGIQLEINEKKKVYRCLQCNLELKANRFRFVYNHVLGFHLKLFHCLHCSLTIKDHQNFREHMLGHEGKYTCDICGKPLQRGDVLKGHRWTHMSEEDAQEAIRNGEKPPFNYLKKRDKPEKREPGNFICSICGKGPYVNLKGLKWHEKGHQNSEAVICSQCGKGFKHKHLLKKHQQLYCFSEKNAVEKDFAWRFQCDICLKKFPLMQKLKQHKLTKHNQEKVVKCGHCDKMFKTEEHRRKHEKEQHLEGNKFECGNGCGARFGRRDALKQHEKKCRGEGVKKEETERRKETVKPEMIVGI